MDKKEALKILELPADASLEKIEKRYELFVRQNKSIMTSNPQLSENVGEHTVDIDRIGEAYRFLRMSFGTNPENAKTQKESKILKKLGIDEKKLRNNIYYYKWHALIIIAVVALVTSFIIGQVRKVDPEAYVAVIGTFPAFAAYQEEFEAELLARVPEVKAVSVDCALEVSSDEEYTEYGMGMQMKKMILISAADVDVYICDTDFFNSVVAEGVFVELSDLIRENNIAINDDSLVLYQKGIFGMTLPGGTVFDAMFGSNTEKILCLSVRAENIEKAGLLMKALAEEPMLAI